MAINRLRDCVAGFTALCGRDGLDESTLLHDGRAILGALIAHDDWLPDAFAVPSPERYQQYLLHCDPLERFSIVSFVWGPGQKTPVHDHLVWGLVGVLRGAEISLGYQRGSDGRLHPTAETHLEPGGIEAVSPRIGDIHVVRNAFADRASISIHVYGGNIGGIRRHVFTPETGEAKPFVSGYSSNVVPNLWDRAHEAAE